MKKLTEHKILLKAHSFEEASEHVRQFFEKTELVMYDFTKVVDGKSLCASDADFNQIFLRSLSRNQSVIDELLATLERGGYDKTSDLVTLEQGYLSKTLHLLVHFLDGFIGIDSAFYNLIDDSHQISESTKKVIEQFPDQYWLIHVDAFSS